MTDFSTWPSATGWAENSYGGVDSLGLFFKVTVDCQCKGIKFWKGGANTTGPWNARLYQPTSASAGTLLASVSIPDNGTSGSWQQGNFSSPVALTAGTWYLACSDRGAYAAHEVGYWVSGGPGFGGLTNGPLVTPDVSGSPYGGQDAFDSSATGAYPGSLSTGGNNYGVDVVVSTSALILDAASPAVTVDGGAGSSGTTPYAFTSNSFTPPGGSVVIVTYETGAASGGVTYDTSGSYPQITDSLGTHLTWNQIAVVYDNAASPNPHRLAAWWAYAGASSPGAMTVTCTDRATAGQISNGGTISVKIWDNASTTAPIGALSTSGNSGSLATLSVSVTPHQSGSAVFLAATVDGTANSSAGSGMTVTDTSGAHYIQEWPGSLTTDTSPVTLTETTSPAAEWQYIAYEVVPPAAPGSALIRSPLPARLPAELPVYQQGSRVIMAAASASSVTAGASAYDIIAGGSGSWVNPANAEGTPDGTDATWTAP